MIGEAYLCSVFVDLDIKYDSILTILYHLQELYLLQENIFLLLNLKFLQKISVKVMRYYIQIVPFDWFSDENDISSSKRDFENDNEKKSKAMRVTQSILQVH